MGDREGGEEKVGGGRRGEKSLPVPALKESRFWAGKISLAKILAQSTRGEMANWKLFRYTQATPLLIKSRENMNFLSCYFFL